MLLTPRWLHEMLEAVEHAQVKVELLIEISCHVMYEPKHTR